MAQTQYHDPELTLTPCRCQLCRIKISKSIHIVQSIGDSTNGMAEYLKHLPPNFPLFIKQTITINKDNNNKEYHLFSNLYQQQHNKWKIIHHQLKGIHTITNQNVIVYFKNQQKIITKYEASNMIALNKGDILYVQPYQVDSSISVLYPFDLKEKLDNVICEHLKSQENKILNQNYKINEEFLEWIYKEYGEEIFYHYLTQFYARVYKVLTKGQIKAGLFFWTSQKKKSSYLNTQSNSKERDLYNAMVQAGIPKKIQFKPKLVNIKGLQIKEYEKIISFEQQYQSTVKKRIQGSSKKSISNVKNQVYRSRITNFHTKLQSFYQEQQQKTMNGIQKQKKYEFEVDSQEIAKLLIPNMGPYKNLRQILNNQTAFRQVFMNKKRPKLLTQNSTVMNKRPNILIHSAKQAPNKMKATSLLWKTTTKYNISSPLMDKKYKKLITTPSTHQ